MKIVIPDLLLSKHRVALVITDKNETEPSDSRCAYMKEVYRTILNTTSPTPRK